MNHFRVPAWRVLLGIVSVLAFTVPAIPAFGQGVTGTQPPTTSTTARISIDSPTNGATVTNGTQILVGGWAVDTRGPGSGIDMVQVYLDGPMESGGVLLGNATYGGSRPDVAQSLGSSALTNTGFDFLWTPTSLSGGNHTIYVYAHSTGGTWSSSTVTVTAPATPTPQPRGGGYGPYGQQGPMTPYGGSFLNNPGGFGFGACTPGYSDPFDPRCSMPPFGAVPPPPPPPPPPIIPGQPCILIYPPDPSCTGQTPGTISAPTGLTVTGVTGTTVTLTWTGSPGATSYRVYQSVALTGFVPSAMVNQTGTSAVVTGLTPNTPYTFQVVAIGPSGIQSSPSNNVPVTTTPGP